MANISIRKLDDRIYHHLCARAKKHGGSMEEEARKIIPSVVLAPKKISVIFLDNFGPQHSIDIGQLSQRSPHDKPVLR